MIVQLIHDDRGQGLAEYGLVLALIATLCVAATAFLGASVNAQYASVSAVYP